MSSVRRVVSLAAIAAFGLSSTSCSQEGVAGPDLVPSAALIGVVPEGGTRGVDPNQVIQVRFSHPVGIGMSQFAHVHEGDVTGPEVSGSWAFSSDYMMLSFHPTEAFKPLTAYTVHLGGGMMDLNGNHVDLERHGFHMGGQWATQSMMGGGMGRWGRTGTSSSCTGSGWAHTNGSYGMIFSFTTA